MEIEVLDSFVVVAGCAFDISIHQHVAKIRCIQRVSSFQQGHHYRMKKDVFFQIIINVLKDSGRSQEIALMVSHIYGSPPNFERK